MSLLQCTNECTTPTDWDELIFTNIKKIIKTVNRDITFLDIGANIGNVAKRVSTLPCIKTVYAIEPNKNSFNFLIENLKNVSNAKLINAAISDTTGIIDLYSGNGTSETVNIIETSYANQQKINSINCITLDSLCKKLQTNFDILKIDVEGSEILVLKEGIETINSCICTLLEVHTSDIFKQLLIIAKENNWKILCAKHYHTVDLNNSNIDFLYQVLIIPNLSQLRIS